ncbi:MAG: hypothetical protein AAGE80_15340 [Pseudomonadota bacterium]
MSGDETVWATKFVNHPEYIFSVRADGMPDYQAFHWAYDRAQPIDPANMPTHLVVEKKPIPSTDIFAIQGGVMVVSARLAELMSGFDLGPAPTPDNPAPPRAELHPMPLYGLDGQTEIAKVALLQVSNHKDGWVPEESLTSDYYEHRDQYSAYPGPQSLTVNPKALHGPDLWRDKRLRRIVFFSDRLHRAMAEAGMERLDEIHPCRMLD